MLSLAATPLTVSVIGILAGAGMISPVGRAALVVSSIYILRISKKAPAIVLHAAGLFLADPARFMPGLRPRAGSRRHCCSTEQRFESFQTILHCSRNRLSASTAGLPASWASARLGSAAGVPRI
jgi:hypothetical protein